MDHRAAMAGSVISVEHMVLGRLHPYILDRRAQCAADQRFGPRHDGVRGAVVSLPNDLKLLLSNRILVGQQVHSHSRPPLQPLGAHQDRFLVAGSGADPPLGTVGIERPVVRIVFVWSATDAAGRLGLTDGPCEPVGHPDERYDALPDPHAQPAVPRFDGQGSAASHALSTRDHPHRFGYRRKRLGSSITRHQGSQLRGKLGREALEAFAIAPQPHRPRRAGAVARIGPLEFAEDLPTPAVGQYTARSGHPQPFDVSADRVSGGRRRRIPPQPDAVASGGRRA